MRVAFVTDSTADLPADLAAQFHISVVPVILIIAGQSLEDGPGIARDDFYRNLPEWKDLPTTASPSAGAYMQAYDTLLTDGYDQVVSIHQSGRLSGTMDIAITAAQGFNGRVHHVDSGQLSMGIGFQVLAAAKAAQQGASLEQIFSTIASVRLRMRVVAMLNTLEYVRRSGRVSWAQAGIGEVLQFKPFISLHDGIPRRQGEARTRQKGIRRLYKLLSDLGPLESLAILHTNPDTDAIQMAANFSSQTQQPPVIVQVTPIIGTHVGPNGLGFAAVVR